MAIWNKLSTADRRAYAVARNGLTILFAYVTVFRIGMCISPLRRDARRNRSAWAALGRHVALGGLAFVLGGGAGLLLGFLFPLNVAFVTGAYLFYAQHNFEGVKLRGRHEWEFTRAALESSSYMPMGPVMQHPQVTRLRVRDIAACLGLKLWDADAQRMVPFPAHPDLDSTEGPGTPSPVAAQ